ncbi:hypothetical protein CAQU_03795 [Corynebacterium aquilae DSM 44791]|uniref:Uncharacterized protein n=1 Tax=Corynebacterium aquilae DSM 44791 TaxID=1431546 RepID=A0A1L7CET8_9CORY|nr:hypothetical protein CAQU_03795 [Corynebacterium aquilae DSM 44791]
MIAVAFGALLISGSSFVALPATIAQLFLLTLGSPVSSRDTTLGVVPLLPALAVWLATAHRVRGVIGGRISLRQLSVLGASTIAVPLLLVFVAYGMLIDASAVIPVAVPPMATSVGRVALLAALAFVAGGGVKLYSALARKFLLPEFFVHGVALGARFVAYSLVVWAVAALAAVGLHWEMVAEFLDHFPSAGARTGIGVLSVLYLPTMAAVALVLGGLGYLMIGTTFVSLGQETVLQQQLPPLPLFAALPQTTWPEWQRLAIATTVSILIAFLVAYRAPRTSPTWAKVFGQLAVATVSVAAGVAVLVFMSTGQIGVMGNLTASLWPAMLSLAGFFFAGSLCALVVTALRENRTRDTTPAEAAAQPDTSNADAEEQPDDQPHPQQDGEADAETDGDTDPDENPAAPADETLADEAATGSADQDENAHSPATEPLDATASEQSTTQTDSDTAAPADDEADAHSDESARAETSDNSTGTAGAEDVKDAEGAEDADAEGAEDVEGTAVNKEPDARDDALQADNAKHAGGAEDLEADAETSDENADGNADTGTGENADKKDAEEDNP